MNVAPPSAQLKADFKKIGDTMTDEWLKTAGPTARRSSTPSRNDPTDLSRRLRASAPLDRAVRRRRLGGGAVHGRHAGHGPADRRSGACSSFNLRGTDAYAGYCMAAAAFLALAHTLKRGEHIRVTLFLDRFGPRRIARAASSGRMPPASCCAGCWPCFCVRAGLAVLPLQRHLAGQRRHAAVDSADRHGARAPSCSPSPWSTTSCCTPRPRTRATARPRPNSKLME